MQYIYLYICCHPIKVPRCVGCDKFHSIPFISTNNIYTQHTERFLTPYTHLWYVCKQTRKTRTRCCKFKQAICHIFPEYTYMYERHVRVKDGDVHSDHHQHHGGAESITKTTQEKLLPIQNRAAFLSKSPSSTSSSPFEAALLSHIPSRPFHMLSCVCVRTKCSLFKEPSSRSQSPPEVALL